MYNNFLFFLGRFITINRQRIIQIMLWIDKHYSILDLAILA